MKNTALNLWEPKVDFPLLACHAAIDLDNLIRKKSEDLKSVTQLIEVISQELVLSSNDPTSKATLVKVNPATAVALNYAIHDSKFSNTQTRLSDVIRQTKEVVECLRKVVANPKKALEEKPKKIEQLKAFCLALSKRALARSLPRFKKESRHPYRR
jgi:DNA repair ATPase RecN